VTQALSKTENGLVIRVAEILRDPTLARRSERSRLLLQKYSTALPDRTFSERRFTEQRRLQRIPEGRWPEPRRLRGRSIFEDTRGIGKGGPESPLAFHQAAFRANAGAGPDEPARNVPTDHLINMVLDFFCS
jgi:hypothetical protein